MGLCNKSELSDKRNIIPDNRNILEYCVWSIMQYEDLYSEIAVSKIAHIVIWWRIHQLHLCKQTIHVTIKWSTNQFIAIF